MIRQSTVHLAPAAPQAYRTLAAACRPRPMTTVSQWADRHRVLSGKGSGEPGRWSTARTPYLRAIMDDLSVTSPVQRVVLMFGAQLGKTEVGLNWIGYVMDHAPAPMLLVVPTLDVRKRWVRQRLDPLLLETPALRKIINARSKRDAGNAEDIKDFPGGMLVIGGANSPASLASMPIRFVLCDEVERFPWEVGKGDKAEGDPLGLIDQRTKTFPRRKVLLVSTPTIKGGRIDTEYAASDQREFHVPCPHCGEYQVLRWRHDDGSLGVIHSDTTDAVWYACRANGCRIEEHHKPQMLAGGRWIARHPERKVRGYHINGLYSPIGLGFTWRELWDEWQDAQGDTAKLKRFINTTLGEVWEEQGDSVDSLALITRLEDYPDDPIRTLPIRAVTAGVDVQKDRIEVSIVGWGPGEEAWLLDHVICDGDTAQPQVWEELDEVLAEHRVHRAGIDAGYNTSMVYAFVQRRSWCTALKGVSGMGRPLIEDERKRRQRLRQRRRKGVAPEPVGVDQGKAIIYARLKQVNPGPGFVHFPRHPAFDDEYFAQLAAEKLVTKVRNGRPFQEWVQSRPRNEALDCFNYALAALRLSGVVLEAAAQPDGTLAVPAAATAADKPPAAPAADPAERLTQLIRQRRAKRHGG